MVPNCIAKYNEEMLEVDLFDWKTQKHRIEITSKKWYYLSLHMFWMLRWSMPIPSIT